jgi:hypothetical protein
VTDPPRKRPSIRALDSDAIKRLAATDLGRFGTIDRQVLDEIAGSNARWVGGVDLSNLQLNLPTQVVDRWRSALEDANLRIIREVSGSMAETIAGASVRRLPDFSNLQPVVDSLGSRIAEQLQPYLADFSRLQSDMQRWIQPAALAAATGFSARMKDSTERFRRYQRALHDQGWWVPPSIGMSTFWEIGRLAEEGPKRRLRQRMVEIGTSPAARRMVSHWMDIPVFRDRRRFILDGLQDIYARRWRVAIPMLLPLIEGITVEAFEPGSRSGPRAILARTPIVSALTADALVETVGILFGDLDFATASATSRVLNRHMVMHGRSTGYGSGENAVRVLFALDQLASTIRHAQQP